MTLILRSRCDLEPDAAAVPGQAPAVAESVDQEQAATTFIGRAPAGKLLVVDPGTRIGDLAADPAPAGLDRDLHRAARPMPDRVRHQFRDDHLGAPTVVGVHVRVQRRLTDGFARGGRGVRGRRQIQRD